MYLLLASSCWWIAWNSPPLIPFSTINDISTSVDRSNFTVVFFKAAFHANPGAEVKRAGSSSYI